MPDQTEMPTAEQMLEKMTLEMSKASETMELLSKLKPSMVREQARSMQFANADCSIPEKYRQLISVAAVAGSGTPSCLKVQIGKALRMGATPTEVVDTLVLARFAVASTVFSNSLEGLRILADSLTAAAPENV
jgi:alkylhydroperoxidase/carboxymuconolactone decarboxylase family protein YurZ